MTTTQSDRTSIDQILWKWQYVSAHKVKKEDNEIFSEGQRKSKLVVEKASYKYQ